MRVAHLIGGTVVGDSVNVGIILLLLLQCKGVAGNHQVFQRRQLTHRVEKLLLMQDFIESEVELFEAWEDLLVHV